MLRIVTRMVESCDKGINQCHARIMFDTDLQEYRVKFYRHTEYTGKDADYHTNSLSDAVGTARIECLKGY